MSIFKKIRKKFILRKERRLQLLSIGPLVAFGVGLCFLLTLGPLRPYILPPVQKFIWSHLEMLVDFITYIFLGSCVVLVFLVFWLDWEDKNMKKTNPHFTSMDVAPDYYRDIKKIDYHKAIKTLLSKHSRGPDQEEDLLLDKPNSVPNPETLTKRPKAPGPGNAFPAGERPMKIKTETPAHRTEDTTDGCHRTYYKDGKIEKELNYKDGKLDGVIKLHYDSGRLYQEMTYLNGKLNGTFKAYDEFGVMYFEMNYKDGSKDGIENIYYPNGILQCKNTYKDGEKINCKSYDEMGGLISDHDYIKDVQRPPEAN